MFPTQVVRHSKSERRLAPTTQPLPRGLHPSNTSLAFDGSTLTMRWNTLNSTLSRFRGALVTVSPTCATICKPSPPFKVVKKEVPESSQR